MARLHGRVAVVAVEQEDLARGLAAAGATVVLVGTDGERAGRVLAAIVAGGPGRGAWFALDAAVDATGDPVADPAGEVDALVAFVAEQFRPGLAEG